MSAPQTPCQHCHDFFASITVSNIHYCYVCAVNVEPDTVWSWEYQTIQRALYLWAKQRQPRLMTDGNDMFEMISRAPRWAQPAMWAEYRAYQEALARYVRHTAYRAFEDLRNEDRDHFMKAPVEQSTGHQIGVAA